MDLGWIATFAASGLSSPQISIAVEGGSGTPVPDVSIEVDDVDKTYARATRTVFEIPYDITTEPWGMRRFHVRDPFGKLINILSHTGTAGRVTEG